MIASALRVRTAATFSDLSFLPSSISSHFGRVCFFFLSARATVRMLELSFLGRWTRPIRFVDCAPYSQSFFFFFLSLRLPATRLWWLLEATVIALRAVREELERTSSTANAKRKVVSAASSRSQAVCGR